MPPKFKAIMIHSHHVESYYNWSNESIETYEKLFDHVDSSPIRLTSVGGGDHILFSLYRFNSIEEIVNADVSYSSLSSTIVKMAVLLCGSYSQWKELCYGSIWEDVLKEILKEWTCFNEVCSKKYYPICFDAIRGLGSKYPNRDKFESKEMFRILRDRLEKVKEFSSVMHDIWSLDLISLGATSQPMDLLILSNAYGTKEGSLKVGQMPKCIDRSVRVDGFITSTEAGIHNTWEGVPTIKLITTLPSIAGWTGHLFKRIG